MMFLLIMAAVLAGDSDNAARQLLEEARHSYDYSRLDDFIAQVAENPSSVEAELLAEALLTKAEWLRIDLENLSEDDHAERQELGDTIDDLANRGLVLCAAAPVTSEWLRKSADLRGTLIRSKFRAKKHRNAMEAEADQAIALDPTNAHAYVTRAKPYLFADDRHGGDLDRALELLNHAIELAPDLESAQLLRAFLYEEQEQPELAKDHFQQILARNPLCEPAREALERLETVMAPAAPTDQ